MKTLKQFNEETGLLKAKSKDEQKFIDAHTKEVIPDANGNGDEVFKASLTKKVDRKKERHGYETGEDEKVYEAAVCAYKGDKLVGRYKDLETAKKMKPGHKYVQEELKGNQHKIDANKNGKIDAHDFVLLRAKKKKMKEEVGLEEGLMHDRYVRSHGKKAKGTGSWAFTTKQFGSPKEHEMHFTSGHKSLSDAHKEAAAKLGTKHLYVMEEVEELDEISAELATRAGDAADNKLRMMRNKRKFGSNPSPAENKASGQVRKFDNYAAKKQKTMEEVEELDELSKGAMLKYLSANKKSDAAAQEKGDYSKSVKRMRGTDVAVRKYTAKPGSKYVRVPATEEVEIEEKTLTPAEMKKREEVVKAIKKGNPKMDKSMAYAIATKTAKKVAEELETAVSDLSERHQDLMFKVFSRLNEQNQQKFVAACQTPEGLESMVAFAIENRGE